MLIIQNDDFDGSRSRLRKRLDEFINDAPAGSIVLHECKDAEEIKRIKNFRFAAAPAFRTFCIGSGLHGVSFDFALPKNFSSSVILEPNDCSPLLVKMMYGHFGCSVYHYDVAFKGDSARAKELKVKEKELERNWKYWVVRCSIFFFSKNGMVKLVESVGGRLPAEHGHGTEYAAPPETVDRWKLADPTNSFNPGVGKSSKKKHWV